MPALRIQNSGKGKAERRNKKSAGKITLKLFILGIIFSWFVENYSVLSKLQEITLNSACFLLQISGIEIEKEGAFIIARDLIALISPECTGFFGIFLLISFILLSNKTKPAKLKGILALAPIAYLTNIFRISITIMLGYYLGPEFFPALHLIFWDFLYLAALFFLCFLFYKIF